MGYYITIYYIYLHFYLYYFKIFDYNFIDEENEAKEQEAERIVDELNNQKCNVDDLEYISKDVLLKVLKFYVKENRKRFKN